MDDEYERTSIRRAAGFMVVVIIITAGFAVILPDIEIQMDFNKYLPDNEVVTASKEMEEFFGKENEYYYILIEDKTGNKNVLTPVSLREQYNISLEAEAHAGVFASYGLAVLLNQLLEDHLNTTILDASDTTINIVFDIFKSVIRGEGNITGITSEDFIAVSSILLSKDFNPQAKVLRAESTVILVSIDPGLDIDELKELCTELRDDLDNLPQSQLELSHTGNYLVTSDIDRIGNQNMFILGFAIVILVTLVLALTFRRFTFVILPLSTLAIAIIWTLGAMALLGFSFTVIDIAVIPLILGLGVDYTVHTSRRYLSEIKSNDSHPMAMYYAQKKIVPAIFLAVLTTSIAFFSNVTSSIEPIRQFGIVCALGIFFAFILTLMFHNTGRVLIDYYVHKRNPKEDVLRHEDTKMVKLVVKTASKSVTFTPVLAMVVVAIITSLAFVGAFNVRTEFSERDFLPEEWDSIETSRQMNEKFEAGRYSEVFVFIKDSLSIPQNIDTLEMLRQIQEFENNLQDDKHVVKVGNSVRTESVLLYIQKILADDAALAALYDTDSDLMPDDASSVNALYEYMWDHHEVADPLTGQTYSERLQRLLHKNDDGHYDALKIILLVRAETTAEMQTMYDELQADLPEFLDTDVVIAGNMIMSIITIDALQSSQINSTILAIVLAFILLVILFRSFGLGLISLVPVVLSTIWILGTMYMFGISLNMLTVMVTALTIGLGLDYAIYIVSRYKEERKSKSIDEAIDITIKGTGSALFISAVTTVCGFAVLMISPIPIIFHFGLIIATTIIYCGVLAVVVLPILLRTWEKFKSGK